MINGKVIDAVMELSKRARAIADYVQTSMMNDYEGFVSSGHQYRKDSEQ